MRHFTSLVISALLFLCAGCQGNNHHETNKSLPLVDEIIPLSCDLEQIKSSIERNRDRGDSFIPITPTDYRKKEDFLTLEYLSMRLQKYNLDKKLESVEDLYLMNGATDYVGKKTKYNNIYIYATRYGVNEIQYQFFPGIRSKDPKIAHQILDSERLEIIGYLNLVTDDDQKSQAILHELETQYQEKLAKKDLIQRRLIVSNVEQDGRMFELIGNYTCRDEEDNCWCAISTINKLIIK